MRIPAIILTAFVLASCKSESEKTKEYFTNALTTSLQDYAFKENYKMTIYSLDVISVDTVNESHIDLLRLQKVTQAMQSYTYLDSIKLELMKNKASQARLYAGIQSKALYDMAADDIKNLKSDVDKIADTVRLYEKISESIQKKIADTVNGKKFYQIKSFLKATEYHGADSINTMDTIYYIFDEQKRMYDLQKSIRLGN